MHASACLCERRAIADDMHALCTSHARKDKDLPEETPRTLLATYMGMHVQLGGRVAPRKGRYPLLRYGA